MAKISRQVGTTNEVITIFIRDATNTSSAGLANVSASSVNFAWCRNNMAAISSGVCTAGGTLGTYSVSTLVQLSSTSTLGWYQFSPPDLVFLSGRSAILHIYGYPNMAPVPLEIELTANTNQSILPVSVSTMSTPVGVSSASVDFGVSTVAAAQKLVGVSTITTPVGVSSASVNLGISSAPILLGVSTLSVPVGVSSYSRDVGVSTIAVGEKLVGVSTIVTAQQESVADALLNRNVSSGGNGTRTVSEALYVLRNRVDVTGGIVYATDDTTTAWTFTASTMAGDPMVAIDPA